MKKLHSISETGLVLFVDEERKGATTQGTKDDCLAYAYKYQSGNCFAYSQNVTQYERGVNVGNIVNQKNRALGDAITFNSGVNSLASGKGHKVAINGSYSTLNGRNGYSENYGENVFSVSSIKNRARYTELHYVGTTTDDTETELFLGGEGNQRFIPNTEYASCYFIQYFATALNAESQEIWTEQNFVAYRNIVGSLQEVGNHSPVTLRDSNLDYDITLNDFGGANHNYISVDVIGEANHNVVWNVVLQITEVRIEEVFSANLILNSKFEELGNEIISNNDFSNGLTGWTHPNNGSTQTLIGQTLNMYTGPSANRSNSMSSAPNTQTADINKRFLFKINASNFTVSGQRGYLRLDGVYDRNNIIGFDNGNNDVYFNAYRTFNSVRFFAGGANQSYSISDLSLKQIDPNDRWTVLSATSTNYVDIKYGEARLVFPTTTPITTFRNTSYTLTAGKTYELELDIVVVSGGIKMDGAGVQEVFNQTGKSKRIIKPTGNTFISLYRATSNVDITIKSVSLKEITYGV